MSEIATGPIKYAVVNITAAASNVIIAAVASRKIRILGWSLVSLLANTLTWEDEDAVKLVGPCSLGATGDWTAPYTPAGWQETPVGKGLNLLASAADQVGGVVIYQEVK